MKKLINSQMIATTFKLLLTLVSLVYCADKEPSTKASYLFGKKTISSGTPVSNQAGQSPLSNTFAICDRVNKICKFFKDRKNPIFEVRGNYFKIFSSQVLKKSLILGSNSKIVDFGGSSGMQIVRNTIPLNINDCTFTKGTKWICSSGNTGTFFLYDMQLERSFMAFERNLSSNLELISNEKCTTVKNGAELICLGFFDNSKRDSFFPIQKMSLNKPNSKFERVSGLSIPKNMTSLDGFNNIIGAVQTFPKFVVTVLNYTSQKVIKRYEKDIPGIRTFHQNLRIGLMVIADKTTTKIYKIGDGSLVHMINAHATSFQFGEVDNNLYYADHTNNEYRILEVSPYLHPNNPCKQYIYAIDQCAVCKKGARIDQHGNCQKSYFGDIKEGAQLEGMDNALKNNSDLSLLPVPALSPLNYNLDIFKESPFSGTIKFKKLRDVSDNKRVDYIQSILNSYFRPIFLSQHSSNNKGYWGWDNGVQIRGNWSFWDGPLFKPRQDIYKNLGHLDDEAFQYEGAWSKGKIFCIFQEPGRNWERQDARFLLFSPDYVSRRVLEDAEQNKIPNTNSKGKSLTLGKSKQKDSLSKNKKYVKQSDSVKGVKDGSYYSIDIPAQWNTTKLFKMIWTAIFGLLKLMITILQIFLIFFTPYNPNLYPNSKVKSMLCSLYGLQYVMTFSLIVGNYGGWLGSFSVSLYSAFLRTLWMNTQSLFSIKYHARSSGLLIPKFQYLGYLRSPLSQHWIELLILCWVAVRAFLSSRWSNYTQEVKKENWRAINLAVMAVFYPLITCSIFSLLTIFIAGIYSFFAILTMLVSFSLLLGLGYFVVVNPYNIKYDQEGTEINNNGNTINSPNQTNRPLSDAERINLQNEKEYRLPCSEYISLPLYMLVYSIIIPILTILGPSFSLFIHSLLNLWIFLYTLNSKVHKYKLMKIVSRSAQIVLLFSYLILWLFLRMRTLNFTKFMSIFGAIGLFLSIISEVVVYIWRWLVIRELLSLKTAVATHVQTAQGPVMTNSDILHQQIRQDGRNNPSSLQHHNISGMPHHPQNKHTNADELVIQRRMVPYDDYSDRIDSEARHLESEHRDLQNNADQPLQQPTKHLIRPKPESVKSRTLLPGNPYPRSRVSNHDKSLKDESSSHIPIQDTSLKEVPINRNLSRVRNRSNKQSSEALSSISFDDLSSSHRDKHINLDKYENKVNRARDAKEPSSKNKRPIDESQVPHGEPAEGVNSIPITTKLPYQKYKQNE